MGAKVGRGNQVEHAHLQAAQALMLDAQRREQEAIARAEEQARQLREQAQQRELLERIEQMQRELGKVEGKIETLEAARQAAPISDPLSQAKVEQPKGFWQRVFGR